MFSNSWEWKAEWKAIYIEKRKRDFHARKFNGARRKHRLLLSISHFVSQCLLFCTYLRSRCPSLRFPPSDHSRQNGKHYSFKVFFFVFFSFSLLLLFCQTLRLFYLIYFGFSVSRLVPETNCFFFELLLSSKILQKNGRVRLSFRLMQRAGHGVNDKMLIRFGHGGDNFLLVYRNKFLFFFFG